MSRERNERLEGQTPGIRARLTAPQDEDGLRRLLEWNDTPRHLAVEKRFLVAQQGEALLAAVEYRVVGRSLLLGPLLSDPWLYDERERTVLEYADAITLSDRDVDDELFGRLKRFLDDALVELTAVIAWENASSKFNRALRVLSQELWRRSKDR